MRSYSDLLKVMAEGGDVPFDGPYKKKTTQKNSDGSVTSPASRVKQLAKQAASNVKKKPMSESEDDQREYNYEGEMSKTKLRTIMRHAEALEKMLEDDQNLPEWVQSKITKAEDYMSTVHNYLMSDEGVTESAKMECPKCKGEGCSHCDDKGYHTEELTPEQKAKRLEMIKKSAQKLNKRAEMDAKKAMKSDPVLGKRPVDEASKLSPAQKKIDHNKNGKIDGEDLAKLRKEESEQIDEKDSFEKKLKFSASKSPAVQSYMKRKAAERSDMNKKNDPNAAKKGYALSATPPERAFNKARKKGMSASQASQAVGTASRNRNRKLPEEVELNENQTSEWQQIQSMEKSGGKRLAYLNAVLAFQKKHGKDTLKTKKSIEAINRSRVSEETDLSEMYASQTAKLFQAAEKELSAYASKHGGMDKRDMMDVAKLMGQISRVNILQAGQIIGQLDRKLKGMDTDPRDKVYDILRKNKLMESIEESLSYIEERNQANALKRKTMDAARGARYKLNNPVPDSDHKTSQAKNKAIGRALRNEGDMTSADKKVVNVKEPDGKIVVKKIRARKVSDKEAERELEEVKKATGDLKDACWKGYTAVGTKQKNGKTVPNCVPVKEAMTDAQKDKAEDIVMGMKKNVQGFKDRYGKKAKNVMYATANKLAQEDKVANGIRFRNEVSPK